MTESPTASARADLVDGAIAFVRWMQTERQPAATDLVREGSDGPYVRVSDLETLVAFYAAWHGRHAGLE